MHTFSIIFKDFYHSALSNSIHDEFGSFLGLLTKVLQKLREVNVQTELDKLDKCKAVGSAKHKRQLTELITEQRNLLADCLFCWACQSPLGKKESCELMDYLKDQVPATSDGTFDYVTLKVVMSLLISWETSKYEELADESGELEGLLFCIHFS